MYIRYGISSLKSWALGATYFTPTVMPVNSSAKIIIAAANSYYWYCCECDYTGKDDNNTIVTIIITDHATSTTHCTIFYYMMLWSEMAFKSPSVFHSLTASGFHSKNLTGLFITPVSHAITPLRLQWMVTINSRKKYAGIGQTSTAC